MASGFKNFAVGSSSNTTAVNKRTAAKMLSGIFMFMAVFSMLSCGNSLNEMQADIYEEYTGKIKDVEEYDSLKKLNGELNGELARLLKENHEQLLEESKKNDKEDIEKLNKAEKAYVDSYIGKIAPLIMQKQNAAYDNAISKVSSCATTAELTSLNSSTYEEAKKLSRENSWEMSVITKRGKHADEIAALEIKKIHYDTLYIKSAAQFITKETEYYTGLAEKAEGYEALKEVKEELDRRRMTFCTEKDTVMNMIIAGNEKTLEKTDSIVAKNNGACRKEIIEIITAAIRFDSVYMEKFIPCLIEKEKEMYEGALNIISTGNDEDFNNIKEFFPGAQRYFFSSNDRELKWLKSRLETDPKAFSEYTEGRNRALEQYDAKMKEKNK